VTTKTAERQTGGGRGDWAGGHRYVACWLVVALAGLFAGASPPSPEQRDKPKKSKKDYSYALLFGTVFDENGRLVRGAGIRVSENEFAVHLPAKAAVYLVEVSAPGFQGDRKEVAVTGDERQDLVFRLARKQQ
jgi:hypothetical protein